MAFHGTFEHSLDAKNRLTVPSKFRSALAGKIFLVKGGEPCLSVYPEETYTRMASSALAGLNPLSAQARQLSRLFYSNAMEIELDGAGRIMLPPFLLEHAGLRKEVVVTGASESLQVWDRATWQQFNSDLTGEVAGITERLGHPG